MGLFFGYTQLGQHVEDYIRLDLKLTRQLVDSDLTHILAPRHPTSIAGL